MADLWEKQIEHPLMVSGFHLPQITLACALRYQSRVLGSEWRAGRPRLAGWMDEIALRPSLAATEAQTQEMLVQAEASR
jgi:glutathione S-transferase